MLTRLARRLLFAAAFAGAAQAGAADLEQLPALNIDLNQSSVSGLSSGAFMAIQLGTAWSSVIKGVGIVAGGPFYCAQASAAVATEACMKGPPPPLATSLAAVKRKADAGDIDPTENLGKQYIYIFHGYNDSIVARSVTDALVSFYEHYQDQGGSGHLFYQHALGSGHAFVVSDRPNV